MTHDVQVYSVGPESFEYRGLHDRLARFLLFTSQDGETWELVGKNTFWLMLDGSCQYLGIPFNFSPARYLRVDFHVEGRVTQQINHGAGKGYRIAVADPVLMRGGHMHTGALREPMTPDHHLSELVQRAEAAAQ